MKISQVPFIVKHKINTQNWNLLNYKYCNNCYKFFADIEEHNKKCKICQKCGQAYVSSHDKDECEYYQYYLSQKKGGSLIKSRLQKKYDSESRIIYADFETFPDFNKDSIIKKDSVYAIGCWMNGKYRKYKGKYALAEFTEMLININKKSTLVFHNGGKFDLYFLYKELINQGCEVKHIQNGGSFKMLKFGCIKTFDLYEHLGYSLKKACEKFGIEADKSKTDFNHMKIKTWEDVEKYEDEWTNYLEKDVLSMKEIYSKYADFVFKKFNVNVKKFMTMSAISYYIWRNTIKDNIKCLPKKIDDFVRKSIYGGRCYPQKQLFESKDNGINDYLMCLDINSQYPTVMSNNLYPIGDYDH